MSRCKHLWHRLGPLFLVLGILQVGSAGYIHLKAVVAQWLLARSWAHTLQGQEQVRPWAWSDTWPVARMEIQRLGVDQIILAGASGRTLAFGPGQIFGTAPPGTRGNSVISGHRDTHFAYLAQLLVGDTIRIERPDRHRIDYRVAQTAVRHQSDSWLLAPTEDYQLVLISCYPFDGMTPGGPLRYVVTATIDSG